MNAKFSAPTNPRMNLVFCSGHADFISDACDRRFYLIKVSEAEIVDTASAPSVLAAWIGDGSVRINAKGGKPA